jgi:hypothetical protein
MLRALDSVPFPVVSQSSGGSNQRQLQIIDCEAAALS